MQLTDEEFAALPDVTRAIHAALAQARETCERVAAGEKAALAHAYEHGTDVGWGEVTGKVELAKAVLSILAAVPRLASSADATPGVGRGGNPSKLHRADATPGGTMTDRPNVLTLLHGWTARFADLDRQWDEARSALADCPPGPDTSRAYDEMNQRRSEQFERLCAEATADFARLGSPPAAGEREAFRGMLERRFAEMTTTELGELSDALAGLEYSAREEGRDAASDPRGFTADAIAILSALLPAPPPTERRGDE